MAQPDARRPHSEPAFPAGDPAPDPVADAAADPTDAETRLDELVAEALDRLEREGEAGLAQLLAAHPDLAESVRRRLVVLRGGGLLDPPAKPEEIEIPV
jgi:hypothetical protein